ncbi:hypothetical protein [Arthrobacter sp. 754]|uniref:hypothetical protein n=1 Tax=Arthrobacter sp. 754 TaxID=3156315 RepID=UPI00339AC476
MNLTPFISYPNRYLENVTGSSKTYARAGIIQDTRGNEAPSVVIFRAKQCLAILTAEDAIRLSNELIDQVERPVI